MSNILNFKSFFKFLGRNKGYTAIDLFGLSVSLMFVILIATYVVGELSTDRYHEHADRIYVLTDGQTSGAAYPLGTRLEEHYPEIEKVCHTMTRVFENTPIRNGENNVTANMMLADATFFEFFNFPLVQGSKEQALAAKNYAVISESFANKFFGNEDPMGKTIRINDKLSLMVNGVMKDIRNSVIPDQDILFRIENINTLIPEGWIANYNSYGMTNVFVMEQEGVDITSRSKDIMDWFNTFVPAYMNGSVKGLSFIPLTELYFWEQTNPYGFYAIERGNWQFVMILLSVGLLILLFAVINYINLTVAQTGFRAKEMATRRLLGSSRKELFSRLIMESTLLTTISFLVGLLLAFFFAPFVSDLLQKKVDLVEMITPLNGMIVILLIALIGFIAGLLPAIVISNAKPIEVVRGTFRKQTKMVFSKFFIVFQNTITICLIAASVTMFLQVKHLINAPLGYNSVNIIDIKGDELPENQSCNTLVSELKQLGSVNRVGLGQGTPFNMGMNYNARYDDKTIPFQIIRCNKEYSDILGFEYLRDNHVADPDKYFLAESSVKALGLKEDATDFDFSAWGKHPVAGIVKDFQLRNIIQKNSPVVLILTESKEELDRPHNIIVEVNGDPFTARREVAATYKKLTGLDFTGKFMDEQIEESFTVQKRTLTIVMIFAGIAILISLLGLLAMSTYFIQQRSSEIAVRKVFGSTNAQVLIRLVKAFLTYVGIAFIIAIPLIWHFVNGWLTDYSYRIELSPWIYVVAGMFCLIVSFVTVFIQSYQAAIANPVENIKDN
ncbi:FtsX-like permease family protein [Parabacteroides sp.]|uniref:ABC transporter permease n=1 Tax=Parabacteroides sp. TaxID=1869337 RepID=UPI00307FF817